jgi:hypothetical protein
MRNAQYTHGATVLTLHQGGADTQDDAAPMVDVAELTRTAEQHVSALAEALDSADDIRTARLFASWLRIMLIGYNDRARTDRTRERLYVSKLRSEEVD